MLAGADGPRGFLLERLTAHAADILAAALLAALLGLLVFSILARDVLFLPTPWLEEIATLTTVYAVAFASIGAWSRGVHIAIDIVVLAFRGRWRRRLMIFLQIFSIGFLLLIASGAAEMMYRSANNKTTALSLSYSYYYAGLLICFVGMSLISFLRVLALVFIHDAPRQTIEQVAP